MRPEEKAKGGVTPGAGKGLGEAARKKEEKKRKGKTQGSLLPAKPVGEEDLKIRDGKQPLGRRTWEKERMHEKRSLHLQVPSC